MLEYSDLEGKGDGLAVSDCSPELDTALRLWSCTSGFWEEWGARLQCLPCAGHRAQPGAAPSPSLWGAPAAFGHQQEVAQGEGASSSPSKQWELSHLCLCCYLRIKTSVGWKFTSARKEKKKQTTTNGCSLKTWYFPLSPSWIKRPLIIMAAKAGSLLRQWEAQNNSFKAFEEVAIGIKTVESQEIMRKNKAMTTRVWSARVWSARAIRPHQAWTFLLPISAELQHFQKGNFGGDMGEGFPWSRSKQMEVWKRELGLGLGLSCSPAALQELKLQPSASSRDRESCDLKGNRKQQLLF